MSETVHLAEYVFTRLRQLGVETVHGVPGDYNLQLLDYVEPQGLHWTGSCNELNGGYAADAYARIKGIGALITTFGVGELSAINAIAGAFAELAPLVHIVGTPTRQQHESRALIHHTLNDGEYGHFAAMAKHVTVAQANLWDPRTAPQELDLALQQCLMHSRPIYVQIPLDMVSVPVSSKSLSAPIEIPPPIFAGNEDAALQAISDKIASSKCPIILVDGESLPYGIVDELHTLISTSKWPTWTSNFAKGLVDESLPNVRGIWKGNWSTPEEQAVFKAADLVFCFGPHFSGTNSYFYTSVPKNDVSIFVKATSVSIGATTFRDLPAKNILSALLQRLDETSLHKEAVPPLQVAETTQSPSDDDEVLTQKNLYKSIQKYLRPGDIVMGETGTAGYGVREFKMPQHTRLFKPSTWLSIGYMLPAAQGAALAQRELAAAGKWHKHASHVPRTVLLIGDGSFQMTAQELSTIIRERLNVTIILINNDGYTIERCIHGKDQGYNDVARWDYLSAPAFFGAEEQKSATKGGYVAETALAKTVKELQYALDLADAKAEASLQMIEVIVGREDAMRPLTDLLEKQLAAKK